jgi:DNA (cytosine-5)-methyltransferase 1
MSCFGTRKCLNTNMPKSIPLIDLFAGPGGLSYGFSAYRGKHVRFDVRLSIEKDAVAWKTLRLRAFVRKLKTIPAAYYNYIKTGDEAALATLVDEYSREWAAASDEVRNWTLGEEPFKNVSAQIATAVGGAKYWVLAGGPPCQAYSLAGRVRMKQTPGFSTDARHTLYREYLKIVAVHQPAVFVMENVKGILSSMHGVRSSEGGVFAQILEDLRSPAKSLHDDPDVSGVLPLPSEQQEYDLHSFVTRAESPDRLKPTDFVIRSEGWGVPQRRHRVILLGIRRDLGISPPILGELFRPSSTTVHDVIGTMPKIRSRVSGGDDCFETWIAAIRDLASSAALDGANASVRWVLKKTLRQTGFARRTGGAFVAGTAAPTKLSRWLHRARLGGVIQHESRSHMPWDLRRYFFASRVARKTGHSPKLDDYPSALLPLHKNLKERRPDNIDFADRFRVQLARSPATTITSHISKDGHYYIHYDPLQCRSLTVREAARLQTFPDDYYFEGNRTEQYRQVGNAVPPLLAVKLAAVVAQSILSARPPGPKVARER